jgi:Mg2+-importing ATPase
LINAVLGFIQEYRSHKTLKILKTYLRKETLVLRYGKEFLIDKKFLVPGDVAILKPGDIIPADLRMMEEQDLVVDESTLTGESKKISKIIESQDQEAKEIYQAKNILFAGTNIISGEARGIVFATKNNTAFGKIAKLTAEIERESPFEKGLTQFSRFILKIVIITLVLVFLSNLIIKGESERAGDFLLFSIALAVSIIPEALPTITSVSLSRGALKLSRKKIVVKRLAAIHDLGSIEILCTDKTGTITENKLKVANVYSTDQERCLLSSILAQEQAGIQKNSFDEAFSNEAKKIDREKLEKFKKLDEIPFDPERRKNSVLISDGKNNFIIVRGAPENILKICSKILINNEEKNITPEIATLETKFKEEGFLGRRVLALAHKKFDHQNYTEENESQMTFLGFISFSDPLKKTSTKAINLAKKMGVEVKILTGDSPEVAGSVGKEIGLIDNIKKVMTGDKLDQLNDQDFHQIIKEFNIFARVSPEQKYKIIQSLEKEKEVGFLGEGINDAPALKIANTAIVVSSASDIAKEAADILLLQRNLLVIIDGIKEGRNIFTNIIKYTKITLISNFGNFYSLALISLMLKFLPMLPIQILLTNLISDSPMIAISADNVDVSELKKPKHYQIKTIITLVFILGFISSIFDFIFFGIFGRMPEATLQTLWFIESILTEIILIFSMRTRFAFFKAKKTSKILALLSITAAAVTIFLPYTSLGQRIFHFSRPSFWMILTIILIVASYFVITEIAKLIYYRRQKNKAEN